MHSVWVFIEQLRRTHVFMWTNNQRQFSETLRWEKFINSFVKYVEHRTNLQWNTKACVYRHSSPNVHHVEQRPTHVLFLVGCEQCIVVVLHWHVMCCHKIARDRMKWTKRCIWIMMLVQVCLGFPSTNVVVIEVCIWTILRALLYIKCFFIPVFFPFNSDAEKIMTQNYMIGIWCGYSNKGFIYITHEYIKWCQRVQFR